MRNMMYRLATGQMVSTQAKALGSGQKFEVVMETIVEPYNEDRLTDKQKANRRKLS